jgi:AcrR family transcriptional regulator
MRARKAKTEIRQEQIARTAMELLAVRGWQRVSLAAIARKVGVVPSAVYRHFASKDKVLDAVLNLVGQSFQANLVAVRQSADNPLTQLQQALTRHANLIASGVPIPRIILSEDVFSGNPRHRKQVHDIYRAYLTEIEVIFRSGQEQGLIRRELATATLARIWLGLVQSPAILWLLGQGDFDLQQHCEYAWQWFAESIRPNQSKPKIANRL